MMTSKKKLLRKLIGGSILIIALSTSFNAMAQSAGTWISDLASQESNNNFSQVNPASTAIGGYQMTEAALVATGYATYNGPVTAADQNGSDANLTFTGKNGINSVQDFLNNPQVQTQAATQYAADTWSTLNSNGVVNSYLGQTVAGQTLNQSALLSGAYVLGPTGLKEYLQNGGQVYTTANGYPCASGSSGCSYNAALTAVAQKRISDGSQYNSSSITGADATVAASQGTLPPGSATPSTVGQLYCAPQVAQMLQGGSTAFVQEQQALAASPQTGFTFLNGNSLYQAGGIAGGASSIGGSTGSYGEFSCLKNLLGGNLGIIFSPPNLSQILSGLVNEVCSAGQSMITQALSPITQNLYQTANIGGFFPGISVPVSAGLSTSFNSGGNTGVSFSDGEGGSTSWYPLSNSTGTTGYGGQSYFGNNLLNPEIP